MDRINGAGTVDIGGGRRGFVDENLPAGTEGTEVTALFLNMAQEEIAKVIEDAGLVLNPADWTQLSQALAIRSARRVAWVPVISMTTTAPPAAPSVGDTYAIPPAATGAWAGHAQELAEWTGTGWTIINPPDGHGISLPDGRVFVRISGTYSERQGRLINTQYFKVAGTYTYTLTPGTRFVVAKVQGGGGPAAGVPATDASSQAAGGAGGNGAYAEKRILSSFSGVAVTVGAGGIGALAAAGSPGGTSSFGSLVSALGGASGQPAGPSGAPYFSASGGLGGAVGTSGDLNYPGSNGQYSQIVSGQGVPLVVTPSPFGPVFGVGAPAAASSTSTAAKVGQNGNSGIVVVEEYA